MLLGEPVGTIAPEIYGHFVEHLGGVVYDGIWVGEELAHSQRGRHPPRAGGGAAPDQAVGDPLARRLLRRLLRLARRRRAAGQASAPHQLLGRRLDVQGAGRHPPALRAERVRHQRVHALLPPGGRAALPRGQRAHAAGRRRSCSGWTTATRPPAPRPWPTSGPRAATATRSGSGTGASATSRGDAAGTSGRRSTPRSCGGSRPGPCPSWACPSPSSARARTGATWTGRAAPSPRWPNAARWTGCGAGPCTTTPASRAPAPTPSRSTTAAGTTCSRAPGGWRASSRRTGR